MKLREILMTMLGELQMINNNLEALKMVLMPKVINDRYYDEEWVNQNAASEKMDKKWFDSAGENG